MPAIGQYFYVDALSAVMIALVSFVAMSVASFSQRYMAGDRKQQAFYYRLTWLIVSVTIMVTADHLVIMFFAWGMSNVCLVRLMLHKHEWKAAKASARLAQLHMALGQAFTGVAFCGLYLATGDASIQHIIHAPIDPFWLTICGFLLLLGAMSQSALWPFHRWLTSSLNSPTPVSAIMHAGLVNGGGFLLARFAPMLLEHESLLIVIFSAGLVTALMGTLWKLLQHDVKRMLACSTMGQMGFMVVQCGLGLFPAAVAHLCWHGLFKAYLFLGSGSAAQERRLDLCYPPSMQQFIVALICGICGAVAFAYVSGKGAAINDTSLFLVGLAFIGAAQFAIPLVRERTFARAPVAVAVTTIMGSIYGLSVLAISALLAPMNVMQPQPLTIVHIVGFIVLLIAWLALLFVRYKGSPPQWVLKAYMRTLNASQPHQSTITAHRNHYHY